MRAYGFVPWYSGTLSARQSPALIDADGKIGMDGKESNTAGILGQRGYELVDHLGNVHAVVSDKRGLDKDSSYTPALMAGYDYYPYGMPMPGRYVQDATQGNGIVSLQQVTTPVQKSSGMNLSQGGSYCGSMQVQPSSLNATVCRKYINWFIFLTFRSP